MQQDPFAKALRKLIKGTGGTSKQDTLVCHVGAHVLGVHPSRLVTGAVAFHAKPVAWDHLMWSILQINGNEALPITFHYTGAFVCATPALDRQTLRREPLEPEDAARMIAFGDRCRANRPLWQDHDLEAVIASQDPSRA